MVVKPRPAQGSRTAQRTMSQAQRGAWTGWAGLGWAGAVTSDQRGLGCRLFLSTRQAVSQPAAHLLAAEMEKHPSIPTAEQLLMESEVKHGRPLFPFHYPRLRQVLPRMRSSSPRYVLPRMRSSSTCHVLLGMTGNSPRYLSNCRFAA